MSPIVAALPESTQRVHLHPDALTHMARYRQRRWYMREAGGQLFGCLTNDRLEVRRATGPYSNDQRSRYGYRSDPRQAQQTIRAMSRKGMLYLGEWHTHPEARPQASSEDRSTFAQILYRSTLSISSLLLVIQGTANGVEGVAIYSEGSEGFHQWQPMASVEHLPGL